MITLDKIPHARAAAKSSLSIFHSAVKKIVASSGSAGGRKVIIKGTTIKNGNVTILKTGKKVVRRM